MPGAERHDERQTARSDAYDILGRLDDDNELFPEGVAYQRLELDRRRRDSNSFVDDVYRGCLVSRQHAAPRRAVRDARRRASQGDS